MPRQPKPKEKAVTSPRPPSIVLSEKQAAFVDNVMNGDSLDRAAKKAGYYRDQIGNVVAKSHAVQAALRNARDELSSAAQISRADVIDGFMEAINLARLGADPMTMVRGWTEVGKMLGFYAPEVKRLEITDSQKRLQSKFMSMSDEDLLRVIEGEATVVLDEEEEPSCDG